MSYWLGVDLGTTFTAAAVSNDMGPPTMIGLGNRALQIPSVLFLTPDGEFLVGEPAERRGLAQPDRLVREFKRRIGDSVPILLAGSPYSPQSLTAKLLRHVLHTAAERMGSAPGGVVLTHPANWGPFKLELLDQVASLAEAGPVVRCAEPSAAAARYAARTQVEVGETIAVYDLGGGTFDACVLQKTPTGFTLLGSPEGIEHLGGIDFDEALFQYALGLLGDRLNQLDPQDLDSTYGLARLRRDCVDAKEALSADTDTLLQVTLPGLSTTLRLTRSEFEALIRPALNETIEALRRAQRSAKVTPDELSAIVLIGGSSRIPLVGELLQQAFHTPTALDTHPKHDVALGALYSVRSNGTQPAPSPPPAITGQPPERMQSVAHSKSATQERGERQPARQPPPPSTRPPLDRVPAAAAPAETTTPSGSAAPAGLAPAPTAVKTSKPPERHPSPDGTGTTPRDGPATVGATRLASGQSRSPGRWRRRSLTWATALAGVGIGTGLILLLIVVVGGSPGRTNGTTGGATSPTSLSNSPTSPANSRTSPATALVVFQDDFSGRQAGWDDAGRSPTGGHYTNGAYRIYAKPVPGGGGGGTESLPWKASSVYPNAPQDIRIAVDARRLTGGDGDGYAIICRDQKAGNYQFTFGHSYLSIGKYQTASDRWEPLGTEKDDLDGIDANATNRLEAMCSTVGPNAVHLVFLVNGQKVAEATDRKSPFLTGTIGLLAGYDSDATVPIEVEFDNLVVTSSS